MPADEHKKPQHRQKKITLKSLINLNFSLKGLKRSAWKNII